MPHPEAAIVVVTVAVWVICTVVVVGMVVVEGMDSVDLERSVSVR